MSTVRGLAIKCVEAQELIKAGYSPEEVRPRFEASVRREEVLRSHINRLKELADRRATESDVSGKGYLATGKDRLLPIPHTLSEAGIRGAATVAGGLYGRSLGKRLETPNIGAIKEMLSGGKKDDLFPSHFGNRIDKDSLSNILNANPKELLSLLDIPTHSIKPSLEGIKSTLSKSWKDRSAAPVWEAIKSTFNTLKDTKSISETFIPRDAKVDVSDMANKLYVRSKVNPSDLGKLVQQKLLKDKIGPESSIPSIAGTIGGAAVGGVVSGLPYALKAMLKKRKGGEDAIRVRDRIKKYLSESDNETRYRDKLLSGLSK